MRDDASGLELADWNNVGMRMKGYARIWPYNMLEHLFAFSFNVLLFELPAR